MIKYISPTSLMSWEKDPLKFWMERLSPVPIPRFPQTQAMSIGSAFDARWKNHVASILLPPLAIAEPPKDWMKECVGCKYTKLVDNVCDSCTPQSGRPMSRWTTSVNPTDYRFHLKTIFDAQVEAQHRPWAWTHSEYLFDNYQKSGALADIMLELQRGTKWDFEFTVDGNLRHKDLAVPLQGKPDCYFKNSADAHVILDLKVNGYCSKSKVAPQKGYVQRRTKEGRRLGPHADAIMLEYKGLMINAQQPMDYMNEQWATQLTIYAWLMGEEVGSDFICGIEQLACGPPTATDPGHVVEFVSLRSKVTKEFQFRLADRLHFMWDHMLRGHIFPKMTQVENDEYIKKLSDQLLDPKERLLLLHG